MDTKFQKKWLDHKDHPKPRTRREFLAQGILDVSAFTLMPSLIDHWMFSKKAIAGECIGGATPSDLIPFLVFDCAGGASLSGNWLVGKSGGATDFLPSYDQLGIPTNPQSGEPIDMSFGAPLFTNLSQVRAGIVASASTSTLANLRMGTICTASQDDTGNNALSPLVMISKLGLAGSMITAGVGNRSSSSGGNSKGPTNDPALKPLTVGSVSDLTGALSFGPALEGLSPGQKNNIARAIANLSNSQIKKVRTMNLGDQFGILASCGFMKNMDYTNSGSALSGADPRLNSAVQSIYGLTPASNGGITAIPTIVYNVLKKNTGPGAVVIGGCDYHDGTQTTGDAKDLQIGTEIGRAIELAAQLNQPLFFAVITDGGIASDAGTRVWRSDAGSKGLAVIGHYSPSGPTSMARTQVGAYNNGQGVDRQTYIGDDPKKAAYVIFANYLNKCGRLGSFSDFVNGSGFEPSMLDSHLIFT